MKKEYKDNQEFFNDVLDLQNELESNGKSEASNILKNGIGLINGLTDGWALFLESLIEVNTSFSSSLTKEQKERLAYYISITNKVVHRE